jgi:L-asparaginase
MEETAYFLNLTVKSDKPVILVGSMRSSTAISADGPGNLYAGVAAAASPNSKGRGVMCCMNNLLLDAKDVIKMHTTDVATFQTANYGKVGYVYNGEAIYNRSIDNLHTTKSEFDVTGLEKLPQVGIVYGYANASPLPFQAFIDAKFDGIVLAGVGDGNFYTDVFDVALKARQKGINVVRSSRCPTGPTCLNGEVDDEKYEFVASLTLNPQKARVLLMLALTKTRDWKQIQEYFKKY